MIVEIKQQAGHLSCLKLHLAQIKNHFDGGIDLCKKLDYLFFHIPSDYVGVE